MPCELTSQDYLPYDNGDPGRHVNYKYLFGEATALFCETCKTLEEKGMIDYLSEPANIWWKKHKKIDEQRIAAELMKKRKEDVRNHALKKLTKEEQEVLGIIT